MTFDDDWWIDDFQNYGGRPCSRSRFSDPHMGCSRLMEQHFPSYSERHDSSSFSPIKSNMSARNSSIRRESGFRRVSGSSAGSNLREFASGCTIKDENSNFEILLDVQQFAPHQITVKMVDDYIVVEGKHEEKLDDHGLVSRQFKRRYPLPHDHLSDDVESSLSSDGILRILAPKKRVEPEKSERIVRITQVGPSGMETRSKSAQRESLQDEVDSTKVHNVPINLNAL